MPLEFANREIEQILRTYRLNELHESDDTIYAMQPDLTLVYVNRGWRKFAAENGDLPAISHHWPLGRSILDAIPKILQPFFLDNYQHCLKSGSPWQHRYECSSASTYREFLMTTYPLGARQGLLVVNSLCCSLHHDRTAQTATEQNYCNADGLIVQCAHCRRVKRVLASTSVWDWVPEWLTSCPRNTSHGLCVTCFGYYYPETRQIYGDYPKIFRSDHGEQGFSLY